MSFILDALKKSEAERQRQSVPGLMDMGPATVKPRFPIWILALGLLLGINLVVLVVVLMRTSGSPATAPAPLAQAAPAAPAASRAASQPFSPMDSTAANAAAPPANVAAAPGTPVYAPEIPVDNNATAPGVTPADNYAGTVARAPIRGNLPASPPPGSVTYAATPGPAAQSPSQPQLKFPQAPAEKEEALPTLAEINLSGNHSLPEMHLDIHVYAARPADRFVFINNQKYKEGNALREGPTVERITRDGVVLSYQALRFFLPRQ